MRTLAFTALDDTLFTGARQLLPEERHLPALLDADGEPTHFTTEAQARLLDGPLSGATLIPVTGRDRAAYALLPPQLRARFTSWAVLDHGATVLRPADQLGGGQPGGGQPDRVWAQVMTETLEAQADALQLSAQAARHISALMQLDCEVRLQQHAGPDGAADGELPLAVVVRHPYDLPGSLETLAREWAHWREESGLPAARLLQAPDQVTLLAQGVSSAAAVRYLLAEERERAWAEGEPLFTLGLGARREDAEFLGLCDYALTPGEGELLGQLERGGGEEDE